MSQWGWVLVGWGATSATVGLYAARLLVRGRQLSRLVPDDRRRWMG